MRIDNSKKSPTDLYLTWLIICSPLLIINPTRWALPPTLLGSSDAPDTVNNHTNGYRMQRLVMCMTYCYIMGMQRVIERHDSCPSTYIA